MVSQLFLGLSLVGAEWVLYLLIFISVLSVALIFERARFYREASREILTFREQVRQAVGRGDWEEALRAAERRNAQKTGQAPDMETQMTMALLKARAASGKPEVLTEVAADSVVQARVEWERNLSVLATIGNNAPFVGLFGTVLGIIKAFHDLSQQAAAGVTTVTAGISEALIATAVGILVAIPAVVAFNMFQRKTKAALSQAEAMKSFLVGRMGQAG